MTLEGFDGHYCLGCLRLPMRSMLCLARAFSIQRGLFLDCIFTSGKRCYPVETLTPLCFARLQHSQQWKRTRQQASGRRYSRSNPTLTFKRSMEPYTGRCKRKYLVCESPTRLRASSLALKAAFVSWLMRHVSSWRGTHVTRSITIIIIIIIIVINHHHR